MNFLERTIATVAPRWAHRRLQHRMASRVLDKQIRKYDGAATTRRTSGWRKVSGSANAETDRQAPILRDRARDLVQNNSWATKALLAVESNVVGAGILAQAKGPHEGRRDRAAQLWRDWAETTACDFEGVHDFYGLQALVMRTVVRDGEVLVRRRRVPGGKIPVQLQVLEADFLDQARYRGDNGNRVIQGVEVDDDGRVVAYWLFSHHPGDSGWLGKLSLAGLTSKRVEASDVVRIYRADRAGQLRGVTWFAPVMVPMRDLDDYEDAQLIRQKVAACFAAFIYDGTGADEVVSADTDSSDLTDKLEPGVIETLPAGKDIKFADPPSVDGYSDFTRAQLRKVAAGLGITYETLTGDYSQVNFSSGRMGWIEMGRNIDAWRWRLLIPRLCLPVWAWFIEGATLAGNNLTDVTAGWTAPRRELINPKDEIVGMKNEIRSGLTSWSEAVRERGFDPSELIKEIAADAARFDAAGLVLDCDPRRTSNAGLVVALPPQAESE